MEDTIQVADGRRVAFAGFGAREGTAVLWCHGGPGSRLAPAPFHDAANEAGLRLVGIDRPGYGSSTVLPGPSVAGWVPDALAVADHLGIDRFVTVGVSTGGAYALAVAALVPARVIGVVACCSVTDMRWQPARATMSGPHAHAVWDAPDRPAALAAAIDSHGEDGHKLRDGLGPALAPSDRAMFTDPQWMKAAMAAFPVMFAQGLEGYTDDRLADGPGWVSFDAAAIRCPVVVLHGGRDVIVDPVHARHTVDILPNARLAIFDDHGHFSIEQEIVASITSLLL